jgi:tetratricopeptide (TPR) repeat protein
MKYYIISILVLVILVLGKSAENGYAKDKQDIQAAIQAEIKAYNEHDYDNWAKFWMQTEQLTRVSSNKRGFSEIIGWDEFIRPQRSRFNTPANPKSSTEKLNFDIVTDGNLAFVKYDEIDDYWIANDHRLDTNKTYAIMFKEDEILKFMYMHNVNATTYDATLVNALYSLNWSAITLYELGYTEKAVEVISLSESLNPEFLQTLWILSEYSERIGEKDKAIHYMKKYLSIYPDNRAAQRRLQKLED